MIDFVKRAKLTELENKILDVSSLATKAALTAAENKMPNVSSLLKKQIIIQKFQKLKINLIIKIMTDTLLLRSLIL